ncbi:MAG: SURF1 family protein [Asticcacaulis sp.]
MPSFVKAAPRGMLVSVIIAFILLNGLGVWQLYRLRWKEGLINDLARTEAMPPVPVEDALSSGKPAWRSVTLPSCTVDPKRLINMHSEMDATPGYRVLTACPLAPGQPYILVDLGFSPVRFALAGPVNIDPVGRLRPADVSSPFMPVNNPASGDWYSRDAAALSQAFGIPLRKDYFLVLDMMASKPGLAGLRQGALTAPLPNRHLEYALTWFGLAWAMVGIFIAFVRQRQREAH